MLNFTFPCRLTGPKQSFHQASRGWSTSQTVSRGQTNLVSTGAICVTLLLSAVINVRRVLYIHENRGSCGPRVRKEIIPNPQELNTPSAPSPFSPFRDLLLSAIPTLLPDPASFHVIQPSPCSTVTHPPRLGLVLFLFTFGKVNHLGITNRRTVSSSNPRNSPSNITLPILTPLVVCFDHRVMYRNALLIPIIPHVSLDFILAIHPDIIVFYLLVHAPPRPHFTRTLALSRIFDHRLTN